MNSEKRYFKTPTRGEFVKNCLPSVIPRIVVILLILPIIDFVKWMIVGCGSFVLFPSSVDIAFYLVFVVIMFFLEFRSFRKLYYRMQKDPFLIVADEGMTMDHELLPSRVGTGRSIKTQLGWAEIRRIEAGRDRFVLYFQKEGKEESIRTDLRWAMEKEDLLAMLKMKCQQHQIIWAEKET